LAQLIIISRSDIDNDDNRFWIGILSLIRLVRLLRLVSVSKVGAACTWWVVGNAATCMPVVDGWVL